MVVVSLVMGARGNHAIACSGPMFREFVAPGSAPPVAVPAITDVVVGALRGVFDARDTCGDLATVFVRVRADPETDLGRFGARLRLVEGELPVQAPGFPVMLSSKGDFSFSWFDPHSPSRRAYRAVLEIALVSPSGEIGPPHRTKIVLVERFSWGGLLGSDVWTIVTLWIPDVLNRVFRTNL
jgi:hypothetical protein